LRNNQQPFLALFRQYQANVQDQQLANRRETILQVQKRLQEEGASPALYLELHKVLRKEDFEAGIAALAEGCQRCPDEKLYRKLIFELEEANRIDDALAAIERARKLFPQSQFFDVAKALLLPAIYEKAEDIPYYRERFTAGLKEVATGMRLETPEDRKSALEALRRYIPFFLGYQGQNDRELLEKYGRIVYRVMEANYLQWIRRPTMPRVSAGERIRVGYLSRHFYLHSTTKYFSGWLTRRNREEFEVFTFYNSRTSDAVTDEIRQASDHFVQIPEDFDKLCQEVLSSNLHILVYLDVRHSDIAAMAALRLAPVQCLAGGHPITWGAASIDYFLSNERMEPENGQEHYSERLIRLPGIGIYFPRPVIPRAILDKKRADFGLAEDRTVYLCCQSLPKYLPQHDDLFARIAKRLPAAQFIFLTWHEGLGEVFKARLARAFAAEGLKAPEHYVVRPGLDYHDYLNLLLVSDVFLDSLNWSGGLTALDAIAYGLPMVTLPGEYMRGRQSYGMLTQLGVTETIARDKDQYVELAVELGRDKQRRKTVSERMLAAHGQLFADMESVRGLEVFYRRVVSEWAG